MKLSLSRFFIRGIRMYRDGREGVVDNVRPTTIWNVYWRNQM
jgi:hypothetical protein